MDSVLFTQGGAGELHGRGLLAPLTHSSYCWSAPALLLMEGKHSVEVSEGLRQQRWGRPAEGAACTRCNSFSSVLAHVKLADFDVWWLFTGKL